MSFRALLLENLWLKIFSFILATLIYIAVQSDRYPFPSHPQTLELRCHVALMAPPGAHSSLRVEPEDVLVKVRGEDAILKKLSPESIQAYVRLPDPPNLNRMFRVEVIVPREVTLTEVAPDQAAVKSA